MASQAFSSSRPTPRWLRRFVVAARRSNVFFLLEIFFAAAFLAMVASTWLTFSEAPPGGQSLPSRQVAGLLVGTLVPAMALLVLLGRRMAIRRAAGSTARLHVRLVFLFSLIAAVPTLLVAGFAAFLFQSGVDFWFSDNSRGLMENTRQLAESFYEENQVDVGNETVAMAGDMRFYLERGSLVNEAFPNYYRYQAEPRDISESAILQAMPDGTVRTAFLYGVNEGTEPAAFAERFLDRVRRGEPVAIEGSEGRIEALAPIDRESGIYLYNSRTAQADSFRSWQAATNISTAYEALTLRARALQLRFNLALFFVSLGLVGLAVWFALRFADRQVEPLTSLVVAAREVGGGNFAMRVDGRTGADEIGLLNRAFNRMTAQLEKQTDALVSANRQLDERRDFIEAVIESVSAGVMSIDARGRILLMNGPAKRLLLANEGGQGEGGGEGERTVHSLVPQIAAMVAGGLEQGIVGYSKGSELLTLAVKIAPERDGHVITFEDITRQLLDQRQAAWSDVARRIAHEIKNPLTPIQLATERLKRRYRRQILEDGELFDELTDTIKRQVGDLRTMVDEFSSFARLPKPVFRPEDALDLTRQSLFLQEVGHSDIDYRLSGDIEGPIRIQCDRHQFGQALTNVLKNAAEAVEAEAARSSAPDYRGRIDVAIEAGPDSISVAVEDNGVGLPKDRERIVEPYVTTRERGTGLGLAIVNKIVEEHRGDMQFSVRPEGGTRVTLRFARDPGRAHDAPQGGDEQNSDKR
ncbi:PAS domain-containing sensor histidine kinase [Erythrobacter sp. HI0063]|jgi:two-component system nitrogen regulation sensor histidine kinase NtrY|uniref:sensor histidine kinase n=1 Tax=Erythrobacter sp. HI0063 TaxID=1822240 RepID=UPI0007C32F24|nr:ATP-binding protein [Erythrobacter sp. HI0063]KZY57282.1 PAS domain-containing sensor histidine kinase [Erythrobacter sp. HI0063]